MNTLYVHMYMHTCTSVLIKEKGLVREARLPQTSQTPILPHSPFCIPYVSSLWSSEEGGQRADPSDHVALPHPRLLLCISITLLFRCTGVARVMMIEEEEKGGGAAGLTSFISV